MIENPYVSYVTGTYNRLVFLQHMVDTFRKSIGTGLTYEIILVDGGSTDGSIEWMKQQPDVVLIEQGKLLGAVKAFRAGFDKARGKYVIIGNDDVAFRYESVRNAVAFMDDNLDVGTGCFPQNRTAGVYLASQMPAVKDGKKSQAYFGQICIVPRWLGDKTGWWDPGVGYNTYAGDCESSCNIIEAGYKVVPMDSCCVEDFVAKDGLRIINQEKAHADSDKWRAKWTKDGLLGPRFTDKIKWPNPNKRVPRMVYAPLYEDNAFPHQLKTKFGLRKALSERYLVDEINYRKDIDNLYYSISMFQPDVCLFQVQDVKQITYDFMMKVKSEFPQTKFISWNGDYHADVILSKEYMQVMKLFDVASFVSADFIHEYEAAQISYRYWQIGFEEYTQLSAVKDSIDICFLGNCYQPQRQSMGEMLRFHKEWNTKLYGAWPSHVKSDGNTMYDFAAGDAVYRSAKIAIADNMYTKSVGYVSNRLFQALHSGVFVLQQKIPGMEELLGFQDGVHFVVWNDLQDLEVKIKEWLGKNKTREHIAAQGKKFVDENHSFKNRVEELEGFISEIKK